MNLQIIGSKLVQGKSRNNIYDLSLTDSHYQILNSDRQQYEQHSTLTNSRIRGFNFEVPIRSYPINQFKTSLPSRCFIKNPLYNISKFKRHLIKDPKYQQYNTIQTSMDKNHQSKFQQFDRKSDFGTRSGRISPPRKRCQTVSARRQMQQTIDFQSHDQYGSDTISISQTLKYNEPQQSNYYLGEIHFENELGEQTKKPIVFAVNSLADYNTVSMRPPTISTQRDIRPISAHSGPNFPFNLNYMLSHLKTQKSQRSQRSQRSQSSYQNRVYSPTHPMFQHSVNSQTERSFSSKVYKKKSNSIGRQFYTDCIKKSNNILVKQEPLKLRPSESPLTSKQNSPGQESDMLANIFGRHKPTHKKKSILLSEI